jgi:hypothetical protein
MYLRMRRLCLFQKQGKGVGFSRGKVREFELLARATWYFVFCWKVTWHTGHLLFTTRKYVHKTKCSVDYCLVSLIHLYRKKPLSALQSIPVTICTVHLLYETRHVILYIRNLTEEQSCAITSEIPTGLCIPDECWKQNTFLMTTKQSTSVTDNDAPSSPY